MEGRYEDNCKMTDACSDKATEEKDLWGREFVYDAVWVVSCEVFVIGRMISAEGVKRNIKTTIN